MIARRRSTIDVALLRAMLCFVLDDAMARPAQRQQVQRFGAEAWCTAKRLAMVHMRTLALVVQRGAATPAPIASVMQRLRPGSSPLLGEVERVSAHDVKKKNR
jgi:hypothetical protein